MPRLDQSEVRRKSWDTRREHFGPRGNPPVPKWRRKPSARAKRIAEQQDVGRVSRQTMEPT